MPSFDGRAHQLGNLPCLRRTMTDVGIIGFPFIWRVKLRNVHPLDSLETDGKL